MDLGLLLVTFGALLFAGLALDALGRMTILPRITLMVLFGLACGPSGLDLLPIDPNHWYDIVAKLALTMVAFLLGGELSKHAVRANGRAILALSLAVTAATMLVIGVGLIALGLPVALAVLLAGIGLATDPAATRDVVKEIGARGRLTKTVLGVVAVDDAWGVIAFSILLGAVASAHGSLAAGLWGGLIEVFGALLLGLIIGLPASYASGRIAPGEPTLAEALGIVLLCAGTSIYFEVSYLLTAITAGAVIVNTARHHSSAFHEIEHISWPFLILFFVLAGASVDLDAVAEAGWLAAAFIVLRLAGRALGGWIGGRIAGFPHGIALLSGMALTPQAGVALGMALVASEAAPDLAGTILAATVATTVFFELVGPLMTRMALRAGEQVEGKNAPGDSSDKQC